MGMGINSLVGGGVLVFTNAARKQRLTRCTIGRKVPYVMDTTARCKRRLLRGSLRLRGRGRGGSRLQIVRKHVSRRRVRVFFRGRRIKLIVSTARPFTIVIARGVRQTYGGDKVRCLQYLESFLARREAIESRGFTYREAGTVAGDSDSMIYIGDIRRTISCLRRARKGVLVAANDGRLSGCAHLAGCGRQYCTEMLSMLPSIVRDVSLKFSKGRLVTVRNPFSERVGLTLLRRARTGCFMAGRSKGGKKFTRGLRTTRRTNTILLMVKEPVRRNLSMRRTRRRVEG